MRRRIIINKDYFDSLGWMGFTHTKSGHYFWFSRGTQNE